MKKPMFSFLVANYNTRRFARELLESMKAQSFSSWEAVIVDDASTDGGIGDIVADMCDERFKLIQLDRNMGASHARNVGFKECAGLYISIVDSDDILHPDYLKEMAEAFSADKEATVAYVDLEYIGTRSGMAALPLKDAEALTLEQWIPHPGSCMPREIMKKSGGYYEGDELKRGNLDWDFFLSIAEKMPFKAIHIVKPLYKYRQHEKNMTLSRAFREYITRECMYRRHKVFFDKHGHSNEFLAAGYYESAAAHWGKREWGEAIRLASKGAEYLPPKFPTLRSMPSDTPHIGRFTATIEKGLAGCGSEAYAPTEAHFRERLELSEAYAALRQWDKAKENLCICLGMAIGNEIPDLAAFFATQLSLLDAGQGNDAEAVQAAELAIMCNPYSTDSLALNIRNAVEAGKTNMALMMLEPWTNITDFAALKLAVPYFSPIWNAANMDSGKIQDRLQAISVKAPKADRRGLNERIYASPLGRRLTWEYRAKDLFERYGENKGGHDFLRRAVDLSGAKKVLEIGCGNGRNLAFLNILGLDCAGQDISVSALKLARQRKLPGVALHCGSLEALGFKENEFDLIVCHRVLQHIPTEELGGLLDEIAKIGRNIYINESLPSDPHDESWYLKKHDLPRMLAERNFHVQEYIGEAPDKAILLAKDKEGNR